MTMQLSLNSAVTPRRARRIYNNIADHQARRKIELHAQYHRDEAAKIRAIIEQMDANDQGVYTVGPLSWTREQMQAAAEEHEWYSIQTEHEHHHD